MYDPRNPAKFFEDRNNPLSVWRNASMTTNRDELPASPRIQQLRAAIAAGGYPTDEKYAVAEERFVATHFGDLNAVNNAEDGEDQEDRDRLIVRPERGAEVEDDERFDADFDGQRK